MHVCVHVNERFGFVGAIFKNDGQLRIRWCDCTSNVHKLVLGYEFSQGDVYQIDMVPLMSLLMGLPIPQNSLGVLPHYALDFLTDRERLQWMYINLQQLLHVYELNQNDDKGNLVEISDHQCMLIRIERSWANCSLCTMSCLCLVDRLAQFQLTSCNCGCFQRHKASNFRVS